MKYKLKDNYLLIYYENGELKENATENLNECKYCEYHPETCGASNFYRKSSGAFCETMKCKFQEK